MGANLTSGGTLTFELKAEAGSVIGIFDPNDFEIEVNYNSAAVFYSVITLAITFVNVINISGL